MIKNFLINWFWNSYDHIGKLMVANLIWFLTSLPVLYLIFILWQFSVSSSLLTQMLLLSFSFSFLLANPAMAGLIKLTHKMANGEDESLLSVWNGLKSHMLDSFKMTFFLFFIGSILGLNLIFYSQFPVSVPLPKVLKYILLGVAFWASLFFIMCSVYTFPVAILQKLSPISALKKSALLVMDNPVFSAAITSFLFFFTLLFAISIIGFILLAMGLFAMAQNGALMTIEEKGN